MKTKQAQWKWVIDLMSETGKDAPQKDGMFLASDGRTLANKTPIDGTCEYEMPETLAEATEVLGEEKILELCEQAIRTNALNEARAASKEELGYTKQSKRVKVAKKLAEASGMSLDEVLNLMK